jgi:hypothetical protein
MMILCDSAAASAGRLQGSSRTKNKTRKQTDRVLMNLLPFEIGRLESIWPFVIEADLGKEFILPQALMN